jgi:hypothetical protein
VKEMALLQVMLGLVLCLDNVVSLGIRNLELLFDSIYLEEDKDYKGYWNKNLDRINMGFLSSMIEIFKKFINIH